MKIKLQHSSMQYSDTLADHAHDAAAVFTPLNHIITGTEAGGDSLSFQLPQAGKAAGYDVRVSKAGEWLAVNNAFARILDVGWISVIPAVHGKAGQGAHQERGIFWATLQTTAAFGLTGLITVGVAHFMTKMDEEKDANLGPLQTNEVLTRAIGDWVHKFGKSGEPVFFNADTNTQDATHDVFMGNAPLVTCWDELDSHPSTGHGCIDVISAYSADKLLRCSSAQVLTDADLQLYSDHYTIEATYQMRSQ